MRENEGRGGVRGTKGGRGQVSREIKEGGMEWRPKGRRGQENMETKEGAGKKEPQRGGGGRGGGIGGGGGLGEALIYNG